MKQSSVLVGRSREEERGKQRWFQGLGFKYGERAKSTAQVIAFDEGI